MNKLVRVLQSAFCIAVAATLAGCGRPGPVTLNLAPPGPADLGPATGLSTPPAGAVVFDLKYLPQTGAKEDIQYHSYWGFGGSTDEVKSNSFLQDVRQKTSGLYYVQQPSFRGRKWAAVEYHGRQATALYFDVSGDGKLQDNERILPTRQSPQGLEFITPDFTQPLEEGGQVLCRVLLAVNFYGGNEPTCMWSPAALLDGTATVNGKPARLILYANRPGGAFDQYGASSFSLLFADQQKCAPGQYVPRETLSSLIADDGQFYRLTIEGRRSNGLPARVVLAKDTSPTGTLAVKLAGTNSFQTAVSSLFLNGVNDKTVHFRISDSKEKITLPVGTYSLANGTACYGGAQGHDWEVSFSDGPWATLKAGESAEVTLGQPTLKVRAIDERERYNSQAAECASFKAGTRVYLEPKVVGKNFEVFSRFRQPELDRRTNGDRPPKITITRADGKEVLSKNMEYG